MGSLWFLQNGRDSQFDRLDDGFGDAEFWRLAVVASKHDPVGYSWLLSGLSAVAAAIRPKEKAIRYQPNSILTEANGLIKNDGAMVIDQNPVL